MNSTIIHLSLNYKIRIYLLIIIKLSIQSIIILLVVADILINLNNLKLDFLDNSVYSKNRL